jgi:hypothetical protein
MQAEYCAGAAPHRAAHEAKNIRRGGIGGIDKPGARGEDTGALNLLIFPFPKACLCGSPPRTGSVAEIPTLPGVSLSCRSRMLRGVAAWRLWRRKAADSRA